MMFGVRDSGRRQLADARSPRVAPVFGLSAGMSGLVVFRFAVLSVALILLATGVVGTARAAPPHLTGANAQGFTLRVGAADVVVQMIAPSIVHVRYLYPGNAIKPALVIDPDLPSEVAKQRFEPTVKSDGGTELVRTGDARVTWSNATRMLTIKDGGGQTVVRASGLGGLQFGWVVLEHDATDAFYGVGGYEANQNISSERLTRAGKFTAFAGKQGHAGGPFVWSTAGYAILLDCDGGTFILTHRIIQAGCGHQNRSLDYYVFVGSPFTIFRDLALVSGHTPLPPEWSAGFIDSQWGLTERELLQIVSEYRKRRIPIDGFALDFDWKAWGKGNYSEFRWNRKKFRNGPSGKLAARLQKDGIHLLAIMKPRLFTDTVEGRYASTHHLWLSDVEASPDYFAGKPARPLNFNSKAARRWFGRLAMKYDFKTGISAWWNDEADEYDSNTEFLNMERSLWAAQRNASDLRVWSLNRNFWLGSQRYSYGLWSGDIDTGFQSMAAQRARMLSAITVGEMQWGMDSGGFVGHPTDQNYARWMEFAAFVPIFRVHGVLYQRREPWWYGKRAEAAAVKAIDLRYSLLPYIYSYDYADYRKGVGLVRPLVFGWPQDSQVRNDVDSWMFGQWLLVSPVMKRGQQWKVIYLPKGQWIDWFSGTAYKGGQTVRYPVASLDSIPLFIRGGAIIPHQPVEQYVGQRTFRSLSVWVLPSSRGSSFAYYTDDGNTRAYLHGSYFLQRMAEKRVPGHGVDFSLSRPKGSYVPGTKWYVIEVLRTTGSTVTVNGSAVPKRKSLRELKGEPRSGWATGRSRFGAVTWVKVPAGESDRIKIGTARH